MKKTPAEREEEFIHIMAKHIYPRAWGFNLDETWRNSSLEWTRQAYRAAQKTTQIKNVEEALLTDVEKLLRTRYKIKVEKKKQEKTGTITIISFKDEKVNHD
jgi:hypothetical protein